MAPSLFERISDHNPQLFRELKGRLRLRNVILAIAIATLLQLLIMGFFGSLLPAALAEPNFVCASGERFCLINDQGQAFVPWNQWWLSIFQALNWILLLVATLPGAYLLVSDIYLEEKRGTLNFIRLSPQASGSILLGKLLGVPALAYLTLLLILPLHLVAAVGGGVPLAFILSLYGLVGAGCVLLYSLALLGGFLGRSQAKGRDQIEGVAGLFLSLTALILFVPSYLTWNLNTNWQAFAEYLSAYPGTDDGLTWFNLPLQFAPLTSHLFTLGNVAIATYWIWQALHRQFHSPSATLLNKGQSYGLMIYLQILIMGFLWNSILPSDPSSQTGALYAWSFCTLTVLVGIILMLSNQRPTLMDWARFHHLQRHPSPDPGRQVPAQRSLVQDLLWSEKSPPLLALGIHLAIAGTAATAWILAWSESPIKLQAIATLILMLNMVALYGAIAQLVMVLKIANRLAVVGAILLGLMITPLILGTIANGDGYERVASTLFLFSPFPMIVLDIDTALLSIPRVGLVCLVQWGSLALLSLGFVHRLNHLGESSSKRILSGDKP